MTPKRHISILAALCALLCGHLHAAEPAKPNVLWI